jgi:hypothetical protein
MMLYRSLAAAVLMLTQSTLSAYRTPDVSGRPDAGSIEAWARTGRLTPLIDFRPVGQPGAEQTSTIAYIAKTPSDLLIAFRCEQAKAPTSRPNVQDGDYVSVALSFNKLASRTVIFTLGPSGVHHAVSSFADAETLPWRGFTATGTPGWNAVVSVPIASLHALGDEVSIGLGRQSVGNAGRFVYWPKTGVPLEPSGEVTLGGLW